MIELPDITDKNIIGMILGGGGGIVRLLLNVDPAIPRYKQFLFLFFAAVPVGWMSHSMAIDYGFEKAAFPIGFLFGIMALSIVTTVARDGAATLIATIIGRK